MRDLTFKEGECSFLFIDLSFGEIKENKIREIKRSEYAAERLALFTLLCAFPNEYDLPDPISSCLKYA